MQIRLDWHLKAAGSKFQNLLDLLRLDVKPLGNLLNAGSGFKVFKDSRHRQARPAKHPCTAHLARNALDRRTLRPIKRSHKPPPSLVIPMTSLCMTCGHLSNGKASPPYTFFLLNGDMELNRDR